MSAPSDTPEGWYSDPHGSGYERRWDGEAWTVDRRRPPSLHDIPPPQIETRVADHDAVERPNRVATASLAVGVVAVLSVVTVYQLGFPVYTVLLVLFAGILSVLALVLGLVGRRRVRKGRRATGRRRATTGAMLGLTVLGFFVAIWLAGEYVDQLVLRAEADMELVQVFRAADYIATGTEGDFILSQAGRIEYSKEEPRFVPVTAAHTLEDLQRALAGRVAAGPISANSIITADLWTPPGGEGG